MTPAPPAATPATRRPHAELTLAEARESPCASCATSPCCTHLPLSSFQVNTLLELDHAIYLLNFDRIELGISAAGEWSAYYVMPCRFLDRGTYGCTLHDTGEQPRICVHYNPYSCWYKKAFDGPGSDEFIRLDRARLELLLEHISFNESREVVSVPDWDFIVALMASYDQPLATEEAGAPEPSLTDPMIEAWRESVVAAANGDVAVPGAGDTEVRSYDTVGDPCTGCGAYCCSTLVFPQSTPAHLSNLDYFKFCLGFPGVELGIADGSWSLVVKTTCRHLDDGRCSVFGQPDRPLICKYYDAMKCDYRPQFGVPRPAESMRVRLEQFASLVDAIPFDPAGNILAMPPMELLRSRVESDWLPVTLG